MPAARPVGASDQHMTGAATQSPAAETRTVRTKAGSSAGAKTPRTERDLPDQRLSSLAGVRTG